MSDILNVSVSRRRFLAASGIAGSLVLAFTLPGYGKPSTTSPRDTSPSPQDPEPTELTAFIVVADDGAVTILSPFVEMGQGTHTAIPMLIAEEMDLDMARIQVVDAPNGRRYQVGPYRGTGGSFSVRWAFEPLRQVGATARTMLLEAAAAQWSVPVGELTTELGFVVHPVSGKRLDYGALAPLAALLAPPTSISLKDPDHYRLLGHSTQRTDVPVKTNGQAQYGIDLTLDNMLVAAVRQSPVFGGAVKRFDASAIANMPGVIAVESLPNGIAVLADHYWQAQKALDALPVEFDASMQAVRSSNDYASELTTWLDKPGGTLATVGNVKAAMASAVQRIEAEYHVPFLAHATLEPMNCTALVEEGKCTVWAPSQFTDDVAVKAAAVTGLPVEAIHVITPFLGGGFGRRLKSDFVTQVVTLAQKHPGRPIKMIWSREEDIQHDFYRPMVTCRMQAGIDQDNNPVAWHITSVSENPYKELFEGDAAAKWFMEGLIDQPYAISHRQLDYHFLDSPFPTGSWRSVAHSHNAFFKESFVDEMAHAVGQDPLDFRRALLPNNPRHLAILDRLATMAQWRNQSWQAEDGQRHAMGIAINEGWQSIVGQIAEVSVKDGTTRVHTVWCVIDCGFAVNPINVTMQMESGIAFGLSAALQEQVTMEEGKVQNSNFHDYPILTAQQMPDIHVEIINSGAAIGGVGEPGTPPIAPAVANALFALTGKRIRTLPFSLAKGELQAHATRTG